MTIAEPIIKRDFSHIIPGTDIFYIIILEEILYRGKISSRIQYPLNGLLSRTTWVSRLQKG